jgi:RNA polymerase sigma factor (sigma-70 family)
MEADVVEPPQRTSRNRRFGRLRGMTSLLARSTTVNLVDEGFVANAAEARSSGVNARSKSPRNVVHHMSSKQPFEAVVEIHGPTVLRVCRAVVGVTDADDAWSETFLSAMKAYPSLPDDANVEAWLVTIAHRKAIDIGRARSRRAAPTDTIVDDAKLPAHTDANPDLGAALAALPDKQRRSVAYHYLAGLPYAEVAAILGGSVEAARRAAADGIATLRRSSIGKPSPSMPSPTERSTR